MANILLIEDDESVARATTLGLQRLGHRVHHETDGSGDLRALTTEAEVVVLDLGLPGADGFEVCRTIRTFSTVPIVILTARSEDIDTVAGLESGADDYVVKPVGPRVLDARLKAVLRRSTPATSSPSVPLDLTDSAKTGPAPEIEQIDDLVINRALYEVRRGDQALPLSPTEFRLVLALADNRDRVLSRQQLLELAWDQGFLGDSRIVDSAIQRLRSKIENDPSHPTLIETVRGFGYRLTSN